MYNRENLSRKSSSLSRVQNESPKFTVHERSLSKTVQITEKLSPDEFARLVVYDPFKRQQRGNIKIVQPETQKNVSRGKSVGLLRTER